MEEFEEEVLRWLAPDETAAQLLARTFVQPLKTGLPLVDRFTTFRGGQVLEIASPAGAGRTTALLQIAATCILPEVLQGVAYGGRGANVLLYDLDGKLDIVRLLEMLDARISQAQAAARAPFPDVEAVMHACLPRLHVVRCSSSFEFLASLRSLQPTLDALASSPGGLACLLIDNVAAFHWLDKTARGAPAAGGGGGGVEGDVTREGAPLTLFRVHAAVAAELRAIQRRYRLPVVASKHQLLGAGFSGGQQQQQDGGWPHRDTMMKPWQDLVTHRLLLRAEAGVSGSGGVGGSGGGKGGAPLKRLAKWHTPEDPTVIAFDIDAAGIHLV